MTVTATDLDLGRLIDEACREQDFVLTRDQAYAISSYIGMGHVSINRVMRGIAEPDACSNAQLPHLLSIKPLICTQDLTLYRGARMPALIEPRQTLCDAAFLSTSLRPETAARFTKERQIDAHLIPHLISIEIPAGTELIPVCWIRQHSPAMPNPGFMSEQALEEAEVLLMPSTAMLVESVADVGDVREVHCRLV